MNWYEHFWAKEKWVKKSVEIEGKLYDRLKEIAANEIDASVNKIIDACINDLELDEKIVIYKREANDLDVGRSVMIRESMYKKLEDMREKYGVSVSKLVNIAIRDGLKKYDNRNMWFFATGDVAKWQKIAKKVRPRWQKFAKKLRPQWQFLLI